MISARLVLVHRTSGLSAIPIGLVLAVLEFLEVFLGLVGRVRIGAGVDGVPGTQPDAAVGRAEFNLGAAAVQFPLEVAARFVGDVEVVERSDIDAAVGDRRRDGRLCAFSGSMSVTLPLVVSGRSARSQPTPYRSTRCRWSMLRRRRLPGSSL